MKREIKFRAWYKGVKIERVTICADPLHIWIDADNLPDDLPEDFFDMMEDAEVGYFILDGFMLEQFTGLRDKNGMEIFEGDVIEYRRSGEKRHSVGEVIYSAPRFQIRSYYLRTPGSDYFGVRFPELIESEVIGNIHDNPELLKETA